MAATKKTARKPAAKTTPAKPATAAEKARERSFQRDLRRLGPPPGNGGKKS